MKASEIAKKLLFDIVAQGTDNEVCGCYVGDMMSVALASLSKNDLWITVQTSMNMVAVAARRHISCIVLPSGVLPDDDVSCKATEEGLYIFSSKKTAYELCIAINAVL